MSLRLNFCASNATTKDRGFIINLWFLLKTAAADLRIALRSSSGIIFIVKFLRARGDHFQGRNGKTRYMAVVKIK
jgi:hypothetical protein